MANKIILSRKGFDSKYGGKPSPILQDGILLSLPIPLKGDNNKYSDLFLNGRAYSQILDQLRVNQKFKQSECHLDPDIYENVKVRTENWRSCYGQSEGPLTHLESNGIDIGDIFIFFGWFKQTVESDEVISYKRGAKDQHIIFGYLEVGKKVSGDDVKEFDWHPHSKNHVGIKNTIYRATEHLMDSDLPGYGTFKVSSDLVLTKEGLTRSKWELPECMKNADITYHGSYSKKEGYFQSAMIGQEFVMDSTPEIEKWILSIVAKNRVE